MLRFRFFGWYAMTFTRSTRVPGWNESPVVKPFMNCRTNRADARRTREYPGRTIRVPMSILQAPLAERISAPADSSQDHWDLREIYDCSYQCFGGNIESACPSDPDFPKLAEYDLEFHHDPEVPYWKWNALPIPRRSRLESYRCLWIGHTQEEAEMKTREEIREAFSKVSKLTQGCRRRRTTPVM